jgi:hypothetical protein
MNNQYNAAKFIAGLPVIKGLDANYEVVERPVETFINSQGFVSFSVEGVNGYEVGDYYGEYRGGDAWIAPELVEYAKAQGGDLQWDNPGCFTFYK